MKKRSFYNRIWTSLSSDDQANRVRALEVLRLMRSGKSLTASSRAIGFRPKDAKIHLGRYIHKYNRRWRPSKTDKIERGLQIYERGKIRSVVVGDSGTASVVGQYMNDVKKVLSGMEDPSILKKYKKMILKDAKGKRIRLEARLGKLKEIELGKEDSEIKVEFYVL